MHQAVLAHGQFILAEDFARQDPNWIATNRRQLTCPQCGQPAYFRARTKDGKAPCFGSRQHQEDCTAATEVVQDPGRPGDEVPAIANDGTEFELVLTGPFAPEDAGERVAVDSQADARAPRAQRHDGEAHGDAGRVRHGQLRAFLRNLVRNPDYMQDRDRTMRVPERGIARTTDLIRDLNQVDDGDLDRHMLVWGAVETARWRPTDDGGTLYLNAGNFGRNPFTIVIEDPAASRLHDADSWLDAAKHAQFNTAPVHAIAFGRVQPGPGQCPYAVTLTDLNAFAFLVGPEFANQGGGA